MLYPFRRKLLLITSCLPILILFYYGISSNSFANYVRRMKLLKLPRIKDENIRGQCCLPGEGLTDICGRPYCNSTCSNPISSIPELDNGKAAFVKKERAFFLETMGNGRLDFRQACAVESLAFFNPNLEVYVLFNGRHVKYDDALLHALRKVYTNLHLLGIELEDYFAGTPLEYWFQCTDWEKGPYHVSHLSDALRFMTLAKYGGYYFDLDVVQVRSVIGYQNFTSTEDGEVASAGAIHANYGHPVMRLAVEEFAKTYKPKSWGYNGPDLLTRVFKKLCGNKQIKKIESLNCQGFQILPKESFYPVHFTKWKEYFNEVPRNSSSTTPKWLTDKVIAVHVWNNLSAKEPIYKNSTQYYVQLARVSCPVTFSLAPNKF